MTVDFYLYDDDGRIVMAGQCPESMLDLQRKPGLTLAKGKASHGGQYVDGGQLLDMPPRPGPQHTFDYKAKAWTDTRTPETQWQVVRRQRDALLTQSDWTQLPDVPLATKETWAIYRQALRDITDQSDPFNVVWPVAPDRKS